MRRALAVGVGLALSLSAVAATAANKPSPQRAPPACAAIAFRPLPSGMTDGEQQAGMYKSRHARLALHAQVKQGEPVDYFVVASGKRLAAGPASLPEAAASCAASPWSSLMPGTSAWQCSMRSTALPGGSAPPEAFDDVSKGRISSPALHRSRASAQDLTRGRSWSGNEVRMDLIRRSRPGSALANTARTRT